MTIMTKNGKSVKDAVLTAVQKFGASRDELIPILNEINHTVGFLPSEAIEEASRLLQVPKSKLYGISTFYQMLSTKQLGRNVIQFCESAPCHVVGGREVWEQLQEELQLKNGETSPDGKWSLVTVSCLGICGVGPVLVINDDIYGNVTPSQIASILSRYE